MLNVHKLLKTGKEKDSGREAKLIHMSHCCCFITKEMIVNVFLKLQGTINKC